MAICAQAQNETAKLEIYIDEEAPNPRTDWDNFATMVCWHTRHTLGDEHKFASPRDFLEETAHQLADHIEWEAIQAKTDLQLFHIIERHTYIKPVYLIDHSGLHMSTSDFRDPWDSGQVGWVYVSKENVRKEYGVKRISKKRANEARNILDYEVKEYDQYISGEVYGYVFEVDGKQTDACGGYFGRDRLLQALKSEVLPAEHQGLLDELQYH